MSALVSLGFDETIVISDEEREFLENFPQDIHMESFNIRIPCSGIAPTVGSVQPQTENTYVYREEQ